MEGSEKTPVPVEMLIEGGDVSLYITDNIETHLPARHGLTTLQ